MRLPDSRRHLFAFQLKGLRDRRLLAGSPGFRHQALRHGQGSEKASALKNRRLAPYRSRRLGTGSQYKHESVKAPRLCVMNLFLHGVDGDPCPIEAGADSLAGDPGQRFNLM